MAKTNPTAPAVPVVVEAAAATAPTATYDQPVFVFWDTHSPTEGHKFDMATAGHQAIVGTAGLIAATQDTTGVLLQRGANSANQQTLGTSIGGYPTRTNLGYVSRTGGTGFVPLYSINMGGGKWYATDSAQEAEHYSTARQQLGYVKPSVLDITISKNGAAPSTRSNAPSGKHAALHYGGSLVIGMNTSDFTGSSQLWRVRLYAQSTPPAAGTTPTATYEPKGSDPNYERLAFTATSGAQTILHCTTVGGNKLIRITDAMDNVASDIYYEVDLKDSAGTVWTLDPEMTNKVGGTKGGAGWE